MKNLIKIYRTTYSSNKGKPLTIIRTPIRY